MAISRQKELSQRFVFVEFFPSKRETLSLCCLYVGPPSVTLGQHSRIISCLMIRLDNVVLMLVKRLRCWLNNNSILTQCILFFGLLPTYNHDNTTFIYCWATVYDAGQTLNKRWLKASYLMCCCPTTTRYSPNTGSMLAHRLRRWHRIDPTVSCLLGV